MIRLAELSDALAIAEIYAPWVRDTAITFEVEPPSEEEIRARIAHTLPTYPFLVFDDGCVQGYAYAGPHNARQAYQRSVNFSVYLRKDMRARGIGRALYKSLISLTKRQGYCMAVGGITLPNEASVRLHESLGFKPVGVFSRIGFKLGAWHDVGWWQRPLNVPFDATTAPPPLSTIPDLQQDPDWERLLNPPFPAKGAV